MKVLEEVLEQELSRVEAPAELWDRVEVPREARRQAAYPNLRWVAVAAVLVLALGLGWRISRRIDTGNAAEIQAWVEKRTGLHVPLHPPAVTRLSGARLAGFGGGAEIAFTAEAVPGVLRVERTAQQMATHGQLHPDSTIASWVSAGQRYTLETSSPQALQTACRLCHG